MMTINCYRPVLVTAPAIMPVTVAEAKAWLDITYPDKDSVIEGLIAAATGHIDGWNGILGHALCEQTWRQDYDGFANPLRLPLSPAISITSVKYDDADDVEQTVAAANYELVTDIYGPFVRFASGFGFPATAAVRVTYLAGYPTSAGAWTGPDAIKHAIALLVRAWFDNPTAVVVGVSAQEMPIAFYELVRPYRQAVA